MLRILNEAIQVEGAEYIGSANGYDVFDILTYAAAQQFTVEDREHLAGAAYTQNEATFNSNINESQHLYFFARENTNNVYGAIVKSANTTGDVTFIGEDNCSITVRCNFMFENAGENSSNTYYNRPLPFFWIPGASFDGQVPEYDCLCVQGGILKAALIQFADVPQNHLLALDDLPEVITSIDKDAFNYGLEVDVIKLTDRIHNLPDHCMNKIHNRILVSMLEIPDDWSNSWNAGKENITQLGYGLDPETVAQFERDRQAALENERQRQAAEQARREEEERRAAEREARKLRYKIKGKEVVITGTRSGIRELTIPEEVEGKPVTTIAAYAFFREEDLVSVTLPRTLKKIEQGAFYGSGVYSITIPKDCFVGKYNDTVKIRRQV